MTHDSPAGTTATFTPVAVAATRTTIGVLPGSGFDEELRELLRSRLIVVHLLALVYVTLLAATVLILPNEGR